MEKYEIKIPMFRKKQSWEKIKEMEHWSIDHCINKKEQRKRIYRMLKPAGWWKTSMNFLASCYSKVVQHTISKYNGWKGLRTAIQNKIPTVEWLILQFFLYSQCRHLGMTILVPRKSSYWIFREDSLLSTESTFDIQIENFDLTSLLSGLFR